MLFEFVGKMLAKAIYEVSYFIHRLLDPPRCFFSGIALISCPVSILVLKKLLITSAANFQLLSRIILPCKQTLPHQTTPIGYHST